MYTRGMVMSLRCRLVQGYETVIRGWGQMAFRVVSKDFGFLAFETGCLAALHGIDTLACIYRIFKAHHFALSLFST